MALCHLQLVHVIFLESRHRLLPLLFSRERLARAVHQRLGVPGEACVRQNFMGPSHPVRRYFVCLGEGRARIKETYGFKCFVFLWFWLDMPIMRWRTGRPLPAS